MAQIIHLNLHRPHIEPDMHTEDSDPLAPARGIAWGIGLSAAFWTFAIAAPWVALVLWWA